MASSGDEPEFDEAEFQEFYAKRHNEMDASHQLSTTAPAVQPPQAQQGILNGGQMAATRKSRSRIWPARSDPHPEYPSLASYAEELEPFTGVVKGTESGRNMLAIFLDIDKVPRASFNIRCRDGRSTALWPNYKGVKDVDIPVGTSLQDVCRYYPLHCWGDGLRIFMAEGWTAEQIWREIPAEARNKGAATRPWNYLQQAMGREADKMYEEAGNQKRVPVKRKRNESEEDVNVSEAHDVNFHVAQHTDPQIPTTNTLGNPYWSSQVAISDQYLSPDVRSEGDYRSGGQIFLPTYRNNTSPRARPQKSRKLSATLPSSLPRAAYSEKYHARSVQSPSSSPDLSLKLSRQKVLEMQRAYFERNAMQKGGLAQMANMPAYPSTQYFNTDKPPPAPFPMDNDTLGGWVNQANGWNTANIGDATMLTDVTFRSSSLFGGTVPENTPVLQGSTTLPHNDFNDNDSSSIGDIAQELHATIDTGSAYGPHQSPTAKDPLQLGRNIGDSDNSNHGGYIPARESLFHNGASFEDLLNDSAVSYDDDTM